MSMSYILQPKQHTDEPTKEGKLAGYCIKCDGMRMVGEERECPKCGSKSLPRKQAPAPKEYLFSSGHTASTRGNPKRIDKS